MKAKGVYNSVGAGSGASRGTKRRVAKRNENDTVCRTLAIWQFAACFVLTVWVIWPVVVYGQTLDTGGWRSAEYSLAQTYQQGRVLDMIYGPEWRQYSDKPIENDSMAQCGPGSCGPGGCPVPQPRMMPNVQRPMLSMQMRPLNERLQLGSMVHVPANGGGIGVHVGNGIVLSCWHGDSKDIAWNGQRYIAQYLGGSVTKVGDVVVLKVDAPFTMYMPIVRELPPAGTHVQWQGGGGTVTRYDNTTVFIRGRCRQGDSGSPIWTRAGLVGILSGIRSDTGDEVIGSHSVFIQMLLDGMGNPNDYRETAKPDSDEKPVTVVEGTVSAETPLPTEKPNVTSTEPAPGFGPGKPAAAGSNAEALILKMAESLEAIHAEVVAIKAREPSTATIKQEVSQAVSQQVTVQAAEFGRQLIDKELVPLRNRMDDLERKQGDIDAVLAGCQQKIDMDKFVQEVSDRIPTTYTPTDYEQLAEEVMKRLPPAQKGEKGDRGEKGEPGTPGSTFNPTTLTDEQIADLAMRLPPIHLRAKDPNTGLLSDEIRVKLGEGGIIVITKDTSPVSGGN